MGNKSNILKDLIDAANEIFSAIWIILLGLIFVALIALWVESVIGIEGSSSVVFKAILIGGAALFLGLIVWAVAAGMSSSSDKKEDSRTILSMEKIAALHGGKCLSREYNKDNQLLIWKCSNGHVWKATSKKIDEGNWCPKCGNH